MNDRKNQCIKLILFMLLCFGISQIKAQTLTKEFKNQPLGEVLKEIERQTNYSIFYRKDEVDEKAPVTKSFNRTAIDQVLNAILGENLEFILRNRMIIISRRAKEDSGSQSRRSIIINGSVVDASGMPIRGVSVKSLQEDITTITDDSGRFSLAGVSENATLFISFVGYESVTVKATDKEQVARIVLQEENIALNEVVVVGYGTQKKVNLTGAVSVVSSDQLASRSAANVSQLLQGTVPNMNVSFSSGRPGQGGSFNIRGVNSISADAAPLVIIDGIEGDINRVNPNDVESVTVLKDASSAAVYGARASYGVILVTTKSGKEGKTSLTYNGRFSAGGSTTSTDYETRGYYSAGINDMFYQTYQGVPYTKYTQEDYYQLWLRRNDKVEDPSRPWVLEENGEYKYYGNFDWYNMLYDHTRPTWEHNLSLTGGSDKVKYVLSGNYYDQKGIIRIDRDNYKKYNFQSKISADVTPWLEISNKTAYFYSRYTYPGMAGVNNIFSRATNHALASIVPINPDGTLVYRTGLTDTGEVSDGIGAVLLNRGHRNQDRDYEFVTTFEAVFKPAKHVDIRTNYSWAHVYQPDLNRSVDVSYSRIPGETIVMDEGRTGGNYLTETQTRQVRRTFNLYGTYDNVFAEKHDVKVMLGTNYDYKNSKNLKMKRNGLLSEDLDDFNIAKGDDISITGGVDDYAILGFFYRFNYAFNDRYLLEGSGRYDGSSRFRQGHRFGFFPSFSAGWRISEESFFENAKKYVDNLKVRASYGSLGNQKTVGYYDYLQLINTGSTLNYSFGEATKAEYARESAPNSTDLTWETVTTKNLGLDIGLMNNRLNITADAYIRDTEGMLMAGKTLPAVYGAASPKMNVADLTTRGWETSIAWNDDFGLAGKPLKYGVTVGLGDNLSRVTKYDNPNRILTDPYEGQQLGEIWGYVVDGFFKTDQEAMDYSVDQTFVNQMINASAIDNGVHAGDLKFVDLDGNDKIEQTTNANDPKDMKVIGNSLPRYNYSLGLSASWNGIDVSAFFQGIGRQHWYPGQESLVFWGPYTRPYASFIPTDFMSRVWSEDNPNAYFPRPRGYVALNNNRELAVVNNRYLQDLAYCRLKSLTVGYTLPERWLSRQGINHLRIYFNGENLLTFSKLDTKYIDPEQAATKNDWKTSRSDARVYPWSKTYAVGLDIRF
ncbi:SusC/RagA family TonB-linked outer membrane protein [Sphingobacterium sp. SGG-5]|uniref:SusC/RagA family TonB-linked outer membrane protein n=1 Tax=Sphingobacterium sp. SGG-5 TaxID=2710881 RepID=UPI0013ED2C9A|nr:SusC/RagA family TonB-linked outer membrane protein [Sphingobacterium sp. SGG-5]NGM62132.1 SusC/RagA family TonB-linked outer membrane protein [Sphingobacterium sp. SGG-5]